MCSQTKGRSVIRKVSISPETIIIDVTENPLCLDHVTLFQTLKDMLDNRIKSFLEA